MTRLVLSFQAPAPVTLQQSPALSLRFPGPPPMSLKVQGIQGPPGDSAGVSDGNKGDITVSGSGAVWLINADAVTDVMLSASARALFAAAVHTHSIAQVTGLQTALDGKQPLATVLTNTTAAFTAAQETKLAGIAAGATVNATDAALRDRATHTGTQAASTISDFNASSRGQTEAALIAGPNITITPAGTGDTRQLAIAGLADPWTPAQLGNQVALWYDAKDVTTLTLEAGAVAAWADKSPNLRHATQTDPLLRPTWSAVANNGLPGVANPAVGRRLAIPTANLLRNETQVTVFAVLQYPAGTVFGVGNGAVLFVSTAGGATATRFLMTAHPDFALPFIATNLSVAGRRLDANPFQIRSSSTSRTAILGARFIETMQLNYAGALASHWTDGTQDLAPTAFQSAGNSQDSDPLAAFLFGGTTTQAPAGLVISELLMVRGSLSADDVDRVHGYLAHGWGVSSRLPGAHPFRNAAPMGATDAALRDRATHTGTQLAITISDFSTAVAATAAVAANTAKVTNATHTGDVTGATALTIANDVVTNAKLANMATATLKGRTTAGTGDPEDLTGTQATTLLDTFTSAAKGLAPASGGGTANFLRADGTWAAPGGGGGGSPGGASGEVQWNNGGAFAGAADVEIEGGQLRLPAIATPSVPSAGGVKLFGRSVSNRMMPAFIGPSGLDTSLQPFIGRNKVGIFMPIGNSTTVSQLGLSMALTGTASGQNVATTNLFTRMRRIGYQVTVASTTAAVGSRHAAASWTIGGNAAGLGGFHCIWRWGPETGVATATHRAFVGMRASTIAPTDVDPSTLTNICGMGYDSADTNIQFMHNDGAGAATKIDLGASFPKPTANRTEVYEVAMFSPPGTTQVLHYEVTNLNTGAVATGTVTTDIATTTTFLNPWSYMSVGGTSSVIGIAIMGLYIESDF